MRKHVEERQVREIRQEYIYTVTLLYLFIKFILILYYPIFCILLYYFIYQNLALTEKKKKKTKKDEKDVTKRCVINKII